MGKRIVSYIILFCLIIITFWCILIQSNEIIHQEDLEHHALSFVINDHPELETGDLTLETLQSGLKQVIIISSTDGSAIACIVYQSIPFSPWFICSHKGMILPHNGKLSRIRIEYYDYFFFNSLTVQDGAIHARTLPRARNCILLGLLLRLYREWKQATDFAYRLRRKNFH